MDNKITKKPRLWSYKSGKKKGQLRTKSKKYLSQQLKLYYRTGLPLKERIIRKKRLKQKKIIKKQRIRKQIAFNYRMKNLPPYFISIRALTINSEISEKGLKIAILQAKRRLKKQEGIDFGDMQVQNTGVEIKKIPPSEDKKLNDNKVHIEVFFAFLNGKHDLLKYYIY